VVTKVATRSNETPTVLGKTEVYVIVVKLTVTVTMVMQF